MAAKQYVELGRVTDSMCLVVAFQSWYVIDALYNEVSLSHNPGSSQSRTGGMRLLRPLCLLSLQTAILTTMDIVTDG
jgi:hypothetical protein